MWSARNFEGLEKEPEQEAVVVDDIVSLKKSMGLEVDSEAVKFVEDHKNELMTEEL